MSEPCPFLRTAGTGLRCAASSEEDLAFIPGGFLQRTCLSDEFPQCARYQMATGTGGVDEMAMAAGADPANTAAIAGGRSSARTLALAAAGVAVLAVACVGLLAVMALLTGGFGLARTQSAVYVEPTALPTIIPTATAMPATEVPATPTLLPSDTPPPEPTATSGVTLTLEPVLPVTDTLTAEPEPTEASVPPTATRRAAPPPSNTPTRVPTKTPLPTVMPTATPLGCNGDERMAFIPAEPMVRQTVAIQVRSRRPHNDVSLTGPVSPHWVGVTRDGDYYVWNWSVVFDEAGTYAYSFKINGGLVCMADIPVTVIEPTATPPPVYGLTLTLTNGEHQEIHPGETAEIRVQLTNTSTVVETFDFGLQQVTLPGGWQAKYCLDGVGCWDYTVQSWPIENVEVNGQRGLSIKLIAPLDAQQGATASAVLWVQSRHGPRAEQAGSASIVQP